MPPRHLAPVARRRRVTLVLTVLALRAGAGGVWWDRGAAAPAAPRCDTGALRLAVAPEVRDPVVRVLDRAGCADVTVTPRAPARVARRLLAGTESPALWVPDSSLWAFRARPPDGDPPRALVDSLARTPVVLAGRSSTPRTWRAALADDRLVLGDPLRSTAAAAALLLGTRALPREASGELLVPLAQRQAGTRGRAPADPGRQAAARVRRGRLTPVPEQQALVHGLDPGSLTVPRSGTWMLDYPLLVTDPEAADAAAPVVDALTSAAATEELTDASFRSPDAGLAAPGTDGGVTVPATVRPSGRALAAALQRWRTLTLPSRALVVVDVSGSMDLSSDAGTRIALTSDAARRGLALFPDAAHVGLWAFSRDLGAGTDHRPLAPVARLDHRGAGRTHRQRLRRAVDALPSFTGGGTGLHDTTLAAYRAVLASYDPRASNSVILLTDGRNDDPDSLTRRRLLDRLRRLQDPARPVSITTIAITHDADVATLRAISRVTGGYAGVADTPADVGRVFAEALSARQ